MLATMEIRPAPSLAIPYTGRRAEASPGLLPVVLVVSVLGLLGWAVLRARDARPLWTS